MTMYEFLVPLVLLGVAGLSVIWLKFAEKRLDARLEAERQAKHPAE